jgi:hypothetical protein
MPLVIVTEKEKPNMMGKKKGFLDYGKDEEEKPDETDDESSDESPAEMRLMHLAEQTGVDDPSALIKLIKACMQQG